MTLKEELQKSFSEQFAVNQNNHKSLFTKILSILISVIIGYGYVFTKSYSDKLDLSIDYNLLLGLTFIASTLITFFGLILISTIALGFRRDQFVVNRIRKDSGLINEINYKSIFPPSFNPKVSQFQKDEKWNNLRKSSKWNHKLERILLLPFFVRLFKYRMSWMPNYHNIHYLILYLLDILLLLSYIFYPNDDAIIFSFKKRISAIFIISILIWFLVKIYLFDRLKNYKNQLNNLYREKDYYA